MRRLLKIILLIPILFPEVSGQSLSSNLSLVAVDYAKLYLQPFADAVGAGLNSGLFFSSSGNTDEGNKLRINFSIESSGTFLPASERSFDAQYIDTVLYNYQGTFYPVEGKATVKNAPTVFGSRDAGYANVNINSSINVLFFNYPVKEDTTEKTIGGVYNSGFIPTMIPQVEIGSLFGTSLLIRALPTIKAGSIGNINFWGLGIKNNFSKYLKSFPVNLSAGVFYQSLTLSDTTNHDVGMLNTFAVNILANKSFGMLNVYGGLQYESATLKTDYSYYSRDSQNPYVITINFTLNGKNSFRAIAGAAFVLNRFSINFDLNAASLFSTSLGLSYSIL